LTPIPVRPERRPPSRAPWSPAGTAPVGPAGRRPAARVRTLDQAGLLAFVRHFTMLYLEVEAGRRGDRQLACLLSPWLRARLAVRPRPGACAGSVHAVAGAYRGPDRFDAVAVVRRGPRYGALAVSLERTARGWLVLRAGAPEHRADVHEQERDNVRSDAAAMAGRPGAS
jgi:hypothetical protein